MMDGEVRKLVALKNWDELMNYDQVRMVKLKTRLMVSKVIL